MHLTADTVARIASGVVALLVALVAPKAAWHSFNSHQDRGRILKVLNDPDALAAVDLHAQISSTFSLVVVTLSTCIVYLASLEDHGFRWLASVVGAIVLLGALIWLFAIGGIRGARLDLYHPKGQSPPQAGAAAAPAQQPGEFELRQEFPPLESSVTKVRLLALVLSGVLLFAELIDAQPI